MFLPVFESEIIAKSLIPKSMPTPLVYRLFLCLRTNFKIGHLFIQCPVVGKSCSPGKPEKFSPLFVVR